MTCCNITQRGEGLMWDAPLQLRQERQEDRKVKESGRERDEPARHLALLRRQDTGNLADNERKSNPNFSLPAQNSKLPHYSYSFCSMWIVCEFSDTRMTFGGKRSTFRKSIQHSIILHPTKHCAQTCSFIRRVMNKSEVLRAVNFKASFFLTRYLIRLPKVAIFT